MQQDTIRMLHVNSRERSIHSLTRTEGNKQQKAFTSQTFQFDREFNRLFLRKEKKSPAASVTKETREDQSDNNDVDQESRKEWEWKLSCCSFASASSLFFSLFSHFSPQNVMCVSGKTEGWATTGRRRIMFKDYSGKQSREREDGKLKKKENGNMPNNSLCSSLFRLLRFLQSSLVFCLHRYNTEQKETGRTRKAKTDNDVGGDKNPWQRRRKKSFRKDLRLTSTPDWLSFRLVHFFKTVCELSVKWIHTRSASPRTVPCVLSASLFFFASSKSPFLHPSSSSPWSAMFIPVSLSLSFKFWRFPSARRAIHTPVSLSQRFDLWMSNTSWEREKDQEREVEENEQWNKKEVVPSHTILVSLSLPLLPPLTRVRVSQSEGKQVKEEGKHHKSTT